MIQDRVIRTFDMLISQLISAMALKVLAVSIT